MLAGRRHVRVDRRLDRAVDVGMLAVPPVLRVIEGMLEVVDRRADVHEAAVQVRPRSELRVRRQRVQREVHLGADAPELETADVLDHVVGQLARVDQLQERAPRVQRADHEISGELGPIGQRHAGRLAISGEDALDGRLGPDLGAERRPPRGQGPA